jgi:hypothetical protein
MDYLTYSYLFWYYLLRQQEYITYSLLFLASSKSRGQIYLSLQYFK